MAESAIELKVGGQSYRVVSRSTDEELQRLAKVVDAKLRDLVPTGRQIPTQALLLVAIALAHEVEAERERRVDVERRSKELLSSMLSRIDEAIETCDLTEVKLLRGQPALAPQHDA